MEKSLLTEVKAILKSLVLSCPDKITVEQLNRDYRDVEGRFIPFRQLGYGNLEQFLRSVPDTLRVFGSGPTAMVCFVANEKSDHIHDMIMRQKKPKSRPRTRSKNTGRSRGNSFHGSNSRNPTKISGQQLSPYQSVNRSHLTKTLQGRSLANSLPPVVQRSSLMPVPLINQIYGLPQPNGIFFNPVVSAIQNGVIKTINTQVQSRPNQLNHMNSLFKNQCYVSNPPPPLPRQQSRNVYLSAERPSIKTEEIREETQKPTNNVQKTPGKEEKTEATVSVIQIKPPTAKKQVSINLPAVIDDDLSDMPKLCKVRNPIEEPIKNSSIEEPEKHEKVQNIKTETSTKQTKPKTFFDDSTDNVEDPDEAIPSFAAKNNVFRLDFPEHTVSYGIKIEPYKLPDDIKVDSFLKIFISEIHSPFKFWFHIYKENHELDLLMYQIERYYSSLEPEDLLIPMMCLTPGQVCAACYNGLWHRGEIVAPPANKTIKVSFMDYGTVAEIKTEHVKFLATFFAQLPAQALRGCLSHIKPRQYHWSHEATSHFLSLVSDLLLYAKITEIDKEKNVLYMILCDTNSGEVVQVNSSLVKKGHAMLNENWKMERIKQNHGKRVHHPREDFPTFSMIENGEYPSFNELVSLQQRGIDYETIYDTIIFNQSTILNKHECASEGLRNLPYFLTTSNPFRSDILVELYATTSKAI